MICDGGQAARKSECAVAARVPLFATRDSSAKSQTFAATAIPGESQDGDVTMTSPVTRRCAGWFSKVSIVLLERTEARPAGFHLQLGEFDKGTVQSRIYCDISLAIVWRGKPASVSFRVNETRCTVPRSVCRSMRSWAWRNALRSASLCVWESRTAERSDSALSAIDCRILSCYHVPRFKIHISLSGTTMTE